VRHGLAGKLLPSVFALSFVAPHRTAFYRAPTGLSNI
jgi:hypothetical protein